MLVLTSFADDTDLSESPHEGTIILFLVRSYTENRDARRTEALWFHVTKAHFYFHRGVLRKGLLS